MDEARTLLRRYVEEGSQPAFAELVARHLDLVYSAALRRLNGDPHRAAEVAQHVFTKLARDAVKLARHTVLTAWLYTATRNAAIDFIRSEQRRRARDLEAHAMQDVSSNEPGDADWSRLAPMLDEVIDELGELDRQAVLLRFVDRRPFAEIGADLRLSEDAARMRVERALEKLRVLLARRGIGSTTAALGVALTQHAVIAAPQGLAAIVTGVAFTSIGATSGPAAILLQFMMTSKIATSVAVTAVLLVALGTATHESRARQAIANAGAAMAADVARFEQGLRDSQSRATAAEKALQEMQASLAAAEAQPAKSASAAPVAITAAIDSVAAGRDLLARHPEVRELWDARERANIAAKFGPVFRLLNLTAAQQDQLATIAIQSMSGATFVNGPDGMITLRREPSLARSEAEAQLEVLLGSEQYARFQELTPLAPTFDLTVKLASALYRSEPLSHEQTERVMQIFANASPVAKGSSGGAPGIDWPAIANAASGVLSPGQLAALEGVQRSFEYQQAVQRLGRAAVQPSLAPKTATAPSR